MSQESTSKDRTPRQVNRSSSGLGRLYRLARKELLEILRDRRTIITLVLMPVLVYPLLGTLVQKFMLNSLAQLPDISYIIGAETEEQADKIEQLLTMGQGEINKKRQRKEALRAARDKQNNQPTETNSYPDSEVQETEKIDRGGLDNQSVREMLESKMKKEPKVSLLLTESLGKTLEELTDEGTIDVGVRFLEPDEVVGQNDKVIFKTENFDLVFRKDTELGPGAAKFITDRIDAVNYLWMEQSLRGALNTLRQNRIGAGLGVGIPFQYSEAAIETGKNTGKPSLLTFIPLMLVLMTMTGAVYPAIDLTAGERERGTMEILISAPVSRMALLFGKFIAVLSVAMLTAIINMSAMMITVYTLGLDSLIFGEEGISYSILVTVFGLLLVFAGFFSAVLLGLTSFAKSFKEAQAYLIPIMLIALAPGLLSLIPDFEMTLPLALAPLLNIVLTARDVISGEFNLVFIAVTVISTVIYGMLALGTAARVFGTDSMLTGGSSSWADFFRRTGVKQDVPSMPTAMLFLAVLFPGFIVLSGLSQRIPGSISQRLIVNALLTVLLFVVLPIGFGRLFRSRSKTSFLLHAPTLPAVIGAICLGAAVWTLAFEIEVLSLTENRLDYLKDVFESIKFDLQKVPLPIKLACLSLAPAVCEEFTFRGFLFSAFRKHVSPLITICVTAVLFGLFHVFVRDALMFERMIPSTMMGLLLGFVCYRTRSVIPGMILHTVHNGLLITMAHYESQLEAWGVGVTEQQHLPVTWLLMAAVPILIGLGLMTSKWVRSGIREGQAPTATPTAIGQAAEQESE